jgi:O-antigen/teichoic acid export membrane protein
MQDVPQFSREWAARDRALRGRQARQSFKVALTTAILVLLCILIWLKLAKVG